MSAHEGHRGRMKKRFLRHGLASFDDHQVLEMLLFYAVPRQDTNELAHRLLDTFGSLDRVFEALPEDLMRVPGIGEHAAALIRLVPEAVRRCRLIRESAAETLTDRESVGRYLLPYFAEQRTEIVMLLCLDAKLKPLDCRQIGSGGLNSAGFSIRDVVQICLTHNARYAVLAHNHVSGIAVASTEDIYATREVKKALGLVGVKLLEHIIVTDEDFVALPVDTIM